MALHADREKGQALGASALKLSSECYEPTSLASAYCRAILGSVEAS
jgi:hypothetical protein